jgi:mannose-6-phosphate isomerase-like protein (cupin superfamily)
MEKIQKSYPDPYMITFARLGEPSIGYISVTENVAQVPFAVKRVFWTYHTPESIVRGRHAHYQTEQVLVAVAGRIIVNTEDRAGNVNTFILEKPDVGLYVPPTVWHTMQYSHSAVQLVFASTSYEESDYIRDFEIFKNG